jgi:predicted phosphodiesterase
MNKKSSFLLVLAASLIIAFSLASSASGLSIIKGPYLQQVTPNSIVIMWETDATAGSRVDYGISAPGEFFFEDSTSVTIHELQLTNLTADTAYYYTVTSGDQTSPTSKLATAPGMPRSFRFVAYGDTRTKSSVHSAVIRAIIKNSPEIVINVGDLVENGKQYAGWQTEFFGPAHNLMINTPMLPVLGNHEYQGTERMWFFDFFSLPNNEQWFAFTYGGVRFIGLNTKKGSYSPGSPQYKWLQGEFQSPEYNNATWHVVYLHHPPYSATTTHGDDAKVKQYLVPLFEKYDVDVVFAGHSHVYERYFRNGIYYIVTGGGGAPLHTLANNTVEPIRQVGVPDYHHCVIDVDVPNSSFSLKAYYNNGVVFDTISVNKNKKAINPNPGDGVRAFR